MQFLDYESEIWDRSEIKHEPMSPHIGFCKEENKIPLPTDNREIGIREEPEL